MPRERPRWTFAAAGFLGAGLLRVLVWTWRVRGGWPKLVFERGAKKSGAAGTIFVHWHSRIMLSAATQAWQGVNVLISRHGDGEYIARIVERLGFETIRGSSTRGGARALLEVVRTLREGRDVAMTPDGPKGPRLVAQAGCVVAAMKSGAQIVPVGIECSRSRRLRSWDRFMVPWAFAKVAVVAGDSIDVPPDLDEAGVEMWRAKVEAAINDAMRRAAELAGVPAETREDPLATSAAGRG